MVLFVYILVSPCEGDVRSNKFPMWNQVLSFVKFDSSGHWPLNWPSRRVWRLNKANLRDLIAATGLVILLKLGSIRRFFSPYDLEIWWMTPKYNRASLLCYFNHFASFCSHWCYFKLCASFHSHWWIQTGVTIDDFVSRVTLQFDEWPWKTIGHLFYATSSFMHHVVAIGEFKLELQSGNA